jgi:hypothetical protein
MRLLLYLGMLSGQAFIKPKREYGIQNLFNETGYLIIFVLPRYHKVAGSLKLYLKSAAAVKTAASHCKELQVRQADPWNRNQ